MAQQPRQRLQQVQQALQIGAVLRGAEVHVVPERLEARGELVAPEVEAVHAQAKAGEGADALHHRAPRQVVAQECEPALSHLLRTCSASSNRRYVRLGKTGYVRCELGFIR